MNETVSTSAKNSLISERSRKCAHRAYRPCLSLIFSLSRLTCAPNSYPMKITLSARKAMETEVSACGEDIATKLSGLFFFFRERLCRDVKRPRSLLVSQMRFKCPDVVTFRNRVARISSARQFESRLPHFTSVKYRASFVRRCAIRDIIPIRHPAKKDRSPAPDTRGDGRRLIMKPVLVRPIVPNPQARVCDRSLIILLR